MKEHLHTRDQAGLFDVSHMGQIRLTGANAAKALETLVPVDIVDLPVGMQRYAMFTNETGGILDDLMVANLGNDQLFLVVNAACKNQDLAHLRKHIGEQCTIEPLFEERALLALQGPASGNRAGTSGTGSGEDDLHAVRPRETLMAWIALSAARATPVKTVSKSPYRPISAEALARRLLAEPEVEAHRPGARDSLRLEAGLCLYGHDMNTETTPIEASLLWAISKPRRADGARAGGFPGAEPYSPSNKAVSARKRVGLLPQERTPVREGAEIVNEAGEIIGTVCSGGFGPTLGGPLAMGYLDSAYTALDTPVWAIVRGKRSLCL
jgi:aminomethyltransferase